jgi:hypothetical protein
VRWIMSPGLNPPLKPTLAPDISGDERYGYLPVGKSTALSEPCQEFGQGSLGARLGCHRGTETQRWKEGPQRRFFSPSPLPSTSLSFYLCVSVPLWQNYGLLSSAGVSRNSTGSWQHSQGPGLYAVI